MAPAAPLNLHEFKIESSENYLSMGILGMSSVQFTVPALIAKGVTFIAFVQCTGAGLAPTQCMIYYCSAMVAWRHAHLVFCKCRQQGKRLQLI
jgi:hypothetical protein